MFEGELMTCVICGKTKYSDPLLHSDWRCLEIDSYKFYVCSDEFPSTGSSEKDFKIAYEVAFACGLHEILKDSGKTIDPAVERYRLKRQKESKIKKQKSKGFAV